MPCIPTLLTISCIIEPNTTPSATPIMPPSNACQPKIVTPLVRNKIPMIIPTLYNDGASAKKKNRPTACCMLASTLEIENRNGLTAITRIIDTAKLLVLSSSPGATTYLTSGSAKIIINKLAAKVAKAIRLIKLDDNSQADFLLPLLKRSLKTGINVTLSAPDTNIKNMKSGIVNATL